MVIEPADGRVPPMTDEGQRRLRELRGTFANGNFNAEARFKGPEDLSLWERCITRGVPAAIFPTVYNANTRIVQGPGVVAITYEMIHDTRIIPIDSRPRLGSTFKLDMGDGRGRWEGDTLVVETTNFRDRSVYQNANPDTLKVTERFTRLSPRTVRWMVTVEDPTTWTSPWTFSMPLTQDETEPLVPYECHEGNYGLKNILSAARADERAAQGK